MTILSETNGMSKCLNKSEKIHRRAVILKEFLIKYYHDYLDKCKNENKKPNKKLVYFIEFTLNKEL